MLVERADRALIQAAIAGDDVGVRHALAAGADANALDARGRSAFLCALTGPGWRDIDPADGVFMSPARLRALAVLLERDEVSLRALNAPQDDLQGVTPLGIAAWLDLPDAVRVILDIGAGKVCIDAPDVGGATALMYAVRDGNVEVVQQLLARGAKPSCRDHNHRSVVQYALDHPACLWLCEDALRKSRARACQKQPKSDSSPLRHECTAASQLPPPSAFLPESLSRTTTALIHALKSSDIRALQVLLPSSSFSGPPFPTSPFPSPPATATLVNLPDRTGWSAMHHAVSVPAPSAAVVDALYLAGADVGLFTETEQYTPLHCLARAAAPSPSRSSSPTSPSGSAPTSPLALSSTSASEYAESDSDLDAYSDADASLYALTTHLTRDLRAPLAARDGADETCVHAGAERGRCPAVLRALLVCDAERGSVARTARNARGLTPRDVARPELIVLFDVQPTSPSGQGERPDSAKTIKPAPSIMSLSSLASLSPQHHGLRQGQRPRQHSDAASLALSTGTSSPSSSTSRSRSSSTSRSGAASARPAPAMTTNALAEELLVLLAAVPSTYTFGGEYDCDAHARLADARALHTQLIARLRRRIERVLGDAARARGRCARVCAAADAATLAVEDALEVRYVGRGSGAAGAGGGARRSISEGARRRTTDSGDSQSTAVSRASGAGKSVDDGAYVYEYACRGGRYRDVAVDTGVGEVDSGKRAAPRTAWLDALLLNADPHAVKVHLAGLFEIDHAQGQAGSGSDTEGAGIGYPGSRRGGGGHASANGGGKRRGRVDGLQRGKLRTWLKRKLLPGQDRVGTVRLEVVRAVDEEGCAVGREVRGREAEEALQARQLVLKKARKLLAIAGRELVAIEAWMNRGDEVVSRAREAILQAERVFERIIDAKMQALVELEGIDGYEQYRSATPRPRPSLFTPPASNLASAPASTSTTLSVPFPSASSLAPPTPTLARRASNVSLASTLIESDDEDMKLLRRLLTRRIQARIDGAADEVAGVNAWLRIVRDVAANARARAAV